MNIVKELKEYKQNKAKINMYSLQKEQLEYILKTSDEKAEKIETESEVIEGMSLSKPKISETQKTNHTIDSYDKIYEIAFSCREEGIEKADKKNIIKQIRRLESIIFSINFKIEYIDKVMFQCLDKKEKFILENLYINKESWKVIREIYEQNFREVREERRLKEIRKNALNKIENVIKTTYIKFEQTT